MRPNQPIKALLLLLALALWGSQVTATEINVRGEVVEHAANGSINWTTGRIEARGYADTAQSPYEQMRAAQLAARAELLTILRGIRIKGDYGAIRGVLEKDIHEGRLEGFLAHSRVTEPVVNTLGLVESTAYVYINDSGNAVLIPDTGLPEAGGGAAKPAKFFSQTAVYTGLIIDARGVPLKPAMSPRVLVEGELTEIYPPPASRTGLISRDTVPAYAGSMEKAFSLKERTGDSPMVVEAIGSANGTDVVIARKDASRIMSASRDHGFMGEGKVVIVVR